MSINRNVFEDLFVLEMANNHWGDLERRTIVMDVFSSDRICRIMCVSIGESLVTACLPR